MSDRKSTGRGDFSGDIVFQAACYELLEKLDDAKMFDGLSINGRDYTFLNQLPTAGLENQQARLKLTVPHSDTHGYFEQTLDDLLETSSFLYDNSKPYYIAELNYYSLESDKPEIISKYEQAISLSHLLGIVSDHSEQTSLGREFIIFSKEKIEVPIVFESKDLSSLYGLDALANQVECGVQGDQRKVILKNVLVEVLVNIDKKDRFRYLLKNFKNFKRKCDDNYALYISGFSFEKLKEDVEEKKLEYISKLNSVISDIQNKILTIPLALILIGGQLKKTDSFNIQNAMIVMGSWVFSILMTILILNQERTLYYLRKDAKAVEARFQNKYSNIADKLKEPFKDIKWRYWQQETVLIGILIAAWFVTFSATYLFDYYTDKIAIFPDAWFNLNNLIGIGIVVN